MTPEAMLQLALEARDREKDIQKAVEQLRAVIETHPQSDAAETARALLYNLESEQTPVPQPRGAARANDPWPRPKGFALMTRALSLSAVLCVPLIIAFSLGGDSSVLAGWMVAFTTMWLALPWPLLAPYLGLAPQSLMLQWIVPLGLGWTLNAAFILQAIRFRHAMILAAGIATVQSVFVSLA